MNQQQQQGEILEGVDPRVVNPNYFADVSDTKKLREAAQLWYDRRIAQKLLGISAKDGDRRPALTPDDFDGEKILAEANYSRNLNIYGAQVNEGSDLDDYSALAFSRSINFVNASGTHKGIYGF